MIIVVLVWYYGYHQVGRKITIHQGRLYYVNFSLRTLASGVRKIDTGASERETTVNSTYNRAGQRFGLVECVI